MSLDTVLEDSVTKAVQRALEQHSKERRLMTISRAATYLDCSESQILNFEARGKLKRVELDRRPRYDVVDLDRLIEESKE